MAALWSSSCCAGATSTSAPRLVGPWSVKSAARSAGVGGRSCRQQGRDRRRQLSISATAAAAPPPLDYAGTSAGTDADYVASLKIKLLRGVRAEPWPGGEPGGPGPRGRGGAGARGGRGRARGPEQGPRQAAGPVAAGVQQRVLVADARRQPPRPAHRPPPPHHPRPGVPEDRRGQQGLRQHGGARARRAVAAAAGRGHGDAGAQVRAHRDLGDQDHVREDDGEDQGEPVAATAAGGAPHPRQPPAAVQHRERRVRGDLPRRRHPRHARRQGGAQGVRHRVS